MAKRHPAQTALAPLLYPFSLLYAAGMRTRAMLYRLGILKTYQPPIPCVCIGNISWGGTGKSPLTDDLLSWAEVFQVRAVVLTRGYGGEKINTPHLVSPQSDKLPSGCIADEPLMLARKHPHARVVIDPKRSRGAQFALNTPLFSEKKLDRCENQEMADASQEVSQGRSEKNFTERSLPERPLPERPLPERPLNDAAATLDKTVQPQNTAKRLGTTTQPQIFLMDDGFQHLAMGRHCNLLLLDKDDLPPSKFFDASTNWNRVLPLGSWREGASALRRANAFLLKCHPSEWGRLRQYALNRLAPLQRDTKRPLFVFTLAASCLRDVFTGKTYSAEAFRAEPYSLLCGVGNPEQVQRTAEDFLGHSPLRKLVFPDHSDFAGSRDEIARLASETPLLCTAKDAVKLSNLKLRDNRQFPAGLYILEAAPVFYDTLFLDASPLPQTPQSFATTPAAPSGIETVNLAATLSTEGIKNEKKATSFRPAASADELWKKWWMDTWQTLQKNI